MSGFVTKALSPETWDAYSALISRNNGVWGGCWCMAFHPEGLSRQKTAEHNRDAKKARVWAGLAHAALVFEGDMCLGWCQFGPLEEVPRIKNRKAYEAGLAASRLPDWRLACLYVEPGARGRGVADAAIAGALELIAAAGGGMVEAYPDVVDGKMSSSFLFHGTASSFTRAGFEADRAIGKTRWVMRRQVGANLAMGDQVNDDHRG